LKYQVERGAINTLRIKKAFLTSDNVHTTSLGILKNHKWYPPSLSPIPHILGNDIESSLLKLHLMSYQE
jgi:hypothetical protein